MDSPRTEGQADAQILLRVNLIQKGEREGNLALVRQDSSAGTIQWTEQQLKPNGFVY